MLCQTSFIVRALSPLPLDYAFRHLRLLIDLRDGDLQPNTCSFFSDDCILPMVCLYLLRAAAAARTSSTLSPFFVAFPESNITISVVYPASRKMEMELILQHAVTSFPQQVKVDCMADDEFGSGLAMENALLSGLAAAFVCDGWIVLEGNLAVYGSSTDWIDGSPAEAVAFAVRTEVNDCIDFLLSPDVIRFRHFKIEKFLMGPLKRLFDSGAVVVLDNYLENMSPDDVQELKCLTIPSFKEGVVSGNAHRLIMLFPRSLLFYTHISWMLCKTSTQQAFANQNQRTIIWASTKRFGPQSMVLCCRERSFIFEFPFLPKKTCKDYGSHPAWCSEIVVSSPLFQT